MPVFSLYILECRDGSLYTGIARDVATRVTEHENGRRGAKYLRGRAPFRLVFETPVGSRSEAQSLELRVKSLSRRQKLALVAGCIDPAELGG